MPFDYPNDKLPAAKTPPTQEAINAALEDVHLALWKREYRLAQAFARHPNREAWLANFIECLDKMEKGPSPLTPKNGILKSEEDTQYVFKGSANFRVVTEGSNDSFGTRLHVRGRTSVYVEHGEEVEVTKQPVMEKITFA